MPAPIVIYDDEHDRSSGDVAVMLGTALAVVAAAVVLFVAAGAGSFMPCDACSDTNQWSPGNALGAGIVMFPPAFVLLAVACCLFQVPVPGRIRPLRALKTALVATVTLTALFVFLGLLMQLSQALWALGIPLLLLWIVGSKLAAQRAAVQH
jgi:hypothetical protein